MTTASRTATASRSTAETSIDIAIDIDGEGRGEATTGLPFFDHMLSQLGRHGGFELRVEASGDLEIDAHHTVEDVGILLGSCFAKALGDKSGVRRFASISVPLDEAVVEAVVDLSGRPFLHYDVSPPGQKILGDPPFDPPALRGVLAGIRHLRRPHLAHHHDAGPQHPPHHRGQLQGGGPSAARRRAGGGHRHPLHQGHSVSKGAL